MTSPIVLLSGGWDSVACLCRASEHGQPVALFFDYGQPYVEPERRAALWAAQAVGCPLYQRQTPTIDVDDRGTFPGRNLVLLTEAARYSRELYFGTRCPWPMFDRHGDGNARVLRAFAARNRITLHLPMLWRPKLLVRRIVTRRLGRSAARHVFSTEGWKP